MPMAKRHDYVLGINAYDHDVSACLLRDGEIAYAIAKERITREKHDRGFYDEVVNYCLSAEGISLDDIGLVVRNCYILPVHEIERRLLHQFAPFLFSREERAQAAKNPLYLANDDRVVTISHHLAHAYSAFAASPFEDGVVMVVDGVGSYAADVTETYPAMHTVDPMSRESESYYRFSGAHVEAIKKVWLKPSRGFLSDEFYNMPGLGALYSRVSSYIFADWNKCGEVMGLAPYGRADAMKPLAELKDGKLSIADWDGTFKAPWLPDEEQNWQASPALKHWQDLAWRIQDDTETVLLQRAKWLRETTGAKNLCIAGGVGLNCVANGRILREAGFDNVFIQPAAGDDGIAIGCAYYGHLGLRQKPRSYVIKHAYFGRDYGEEDVRAATENRAVRLEMNATRTSDICRDTAQALAEGQVVGWFQGRSEFGPRALGNRSILADPRRPEMKDILNSRVKFRQAFRPFAPIVLAERAAEVFETEVESPFMLLAMRVRPEWQERIPAVVHVDGTARLQTVRFDTNPRLHRLLTEFEALTGVPVLLNTSFNIKGEPIVETPRDAVDCFLGTGIDVLALHDRLISKSRLHGLILPFKRAYSDVNTMVRTGLSVGAPAPGAGY